MYSGVSNVWRVAGGAPNEPTRGVTRPAPYSDSIVTRKPMARSRFSKSAPAAAKAWSWTLKMPPAVGVPLITPVVVLTAKPAGRPVAL